MFSLAIIADVHGNRLALGAILADIAQRGLNDIVNLGDSLDRCMDPGGTAELLMRRSIPSLAGNAETFANEQLTEAQRSWLTALPKTLDLGEVFCCHGTPTSDHQELLEDVTAGHPHLASAETITERLVGVKHAVVLCAHTHVPRTVWLPNGQLVVNPGSVGLPAYTHDEPVAHVMEAGSPHARYAVLTRQPSGWSVEHVALAYPWDDAAIMARAAGREDRAGWLETGRASLKSKSVKHT